MSQGRLNIGCVMFITVFTLVVTVISVLTGFSWQKALVLTIVVFTIFLNGHALYRHHYIAQEKPGMVLWAWLQIGFIVFIGYVTLFHT